MSNDEKNKLITSFLIFIIASGLIIVFFCLNKVKTPVTETLKHVSYSYSIQNKTNKLLNDGNLWFYAPVKQDSFQLCTAIKTDFPYRLISMENGNQVLHFKINDLAPFAAQVINLQVTLKFISFPRSTPLDSKEIYLSPQKYMESAHPDIIHLAKELKRASPIKTAENIYNWVSSNIADSGYIKNTRGAMYALKHRKGDCTEYMSLFVALCRANNIPARGVGGYVCKGNCILSPSAYHNWAEFYTDKTWLLADCQKKVFNRKNDQYIAVRIVQEDKNNPMKEYSRFRFTGTGIKVKMNQ